MEIPYVLVIICLTLNKITGETTEANLETTTDNLDYSLSSETVDQINSAEFKRLKREPPPPFTIIKHKTILIKEPPKQRGRIKYPRTTYGSPNYKNGELLNFYRTQNGQRFGGSVIRAKPEYVILRGNADKIKPEILLVEDNPAKGKIGYLLSGVNGQKSTTQYIIYQTEKKPTVNDNYQIVLKGHDAYGPPLQNNNLPFSSKPHDKYGLPKSYDPPLKDIENGDKHKDTHLVYAPEFAIKPASPSDEYQVPNGLPESFKSGFIGPSYLPPPDFHHGYNYTKPDHIGKEISSPVVSAHVGLDEIFDSSKLPLEELKKHPNFDYEKTSYEVPIYEPVIFDPQALGSHEFFPPNLSDTFNEQKFSTIAKGSTKIEVTLPKKPEFDDSREAKTYKSRKKQITPSSYSNEFSTFVNSLQSLRTSIDILSETPSSVSTDLTTSSPAPSGTTRRIRKKKRKTRVSNIKRHILDIDSLKKALGDTQQNNSDAYDLVARPFQNARSRIPVIPSWESVKIGSSNNLKASDNSKTNDVTLISIQKSQSHSYYDGTIPPETVKRLLYNPQKQIDNNTNNPQFQSTSRKSRTKNEDPLKSSSRFTQEVESLR